LGLVAGTIRGEGKLISDPKTVFRLSEKISFNCSTIDFIFNTNYAFSIQMGN
jgi:hypothetical protein